eukprot:tig00020961_g16751.t1
MPREFIDVTNPPYPVKSANPSPGEIVREMGWSEYRNIIALTLCSIPVGYLASCKVTARGTAGFAGLIGFLGGVSWGAQRAGQRLMGVRAPEA